eukprot:TRINITY_DN5544_c0_g1_i4.p1 TRINITY_DN5544_c0_g1~~TRINITY_DN5544_c0_g1_i4.p1  ORF type:complete len:448 (-),score=75.62 TRINITY_DN5544_c0_g1_i4:44-1387(-)
MNSASFTQQLNDYNNKGFAQHPSHNNAIIRSRHNQKESTGNEEEEKEKTKYKKRVFGDAGDVEGFKGPWTPWDEELEMNRKLNENALTAEQVEEIQSQIKKVKAAPVRETFKIRSIFHGEQFRDYLGRTFVEPPTDLKPVEHDCYLPKKLVHTWSGHSKGVNAIRFFPKYGHLLLSACNDGQVKIWDVYNKQKCIRTYIGHQKGVRDICFSNDGRRFLSTGYDNNINLWDTETGECIGSYSNGKTSLCVKFNPDEDKQNQFLAGSSDKKIYQWDINTGKTVQEYDEHLGAVNTITFVDENRRFITTSDDKSIRVWEWGIPVVIKTISEPHMHSIPSIAVSPDRNWFVGQSLDNQLIVYSTNDKFRMKRAFKGHITAGFACQVNFSPDGHWLMSGDSDGGLWFWDWNTGRIMKKIHAHNGVCIGAEWHPIETSKVATCGWDGNIHYWD